uniref:Tubulin--tyrosine ligase-like protein 5 n=1 Tax=Meloidogyne hapla TaxID=6305 RepID=A0A1I8BMM5_MELHA
MDVDTKTLNSLSNASDLTNTINGGKDYFLLTFDPIAFKYIGRRVVGSSTQRKFTKLGEDFNICFKLIKSDSKLVKSLLFSYGFLQCSSKNPHCNLIWTNTHLSTNSMRQLKLWQRMNHFPRSWMLTKKDCLYENVNRAGVLYGQDYFNFIPDFFCTPLCDEDTTSLINCCKEIENGKQSPFIVKPAGGSFGKGIFFLSRAVEVYSVDNSQKLVISRYIERPLLINGLKWDLRIYVLVTSFYPLIVYMYSDGLARFAVHTYKDGKTNFDDLNQHLTNYVLNKTSEYFIRNTDCSVEDMGHKWTLGALLRHLEENSDVDTELLMVRIEDIVIKSLLSIQPRVAAMCRKLNLHPKCCFELFGFDILVDEHLKPWLLEMNLSPSLSCDSPLDTLLKSHLFCDVLNIASIPLVSDKNIENECYYGEEEYELTDQHQKQFKKHLNDEKLDNENKQNLQNSLQPQTPSTSSLSNSSINGFIPLSTNDIDEEMLQQCSTNKRKLSPKQQLRASKIKKMQTPQKVSFSSERMSALYLERVELLFEKLMIENKRRGHFNRIFPRRTTWRMYCTILEDCGQEHWDKALHNLLSNEYNQSSSPPKLSMFDVQLTHEQLMNAEKFPKRELLDPAVKNIALAEALEEANCYKMKKVYTTGSSGDLRPYPSALPKLRPIARRRTKSQCIADELKQEKLEKKKEELAAATASTSLNNSTNSPTAPLLELDPNLPSLALKETEGTKYAINENQKMKKNNSVNGII